MCWNASISLNTYLFSLFASVLAIANGVISIPAFVAYQAFCTMQLIEYFTWSKTFDNKLLSQIAAILVLSQPVISFAILIVNKEVKMYLPYLIVSYILFLFVFVSIWKPWSKVTFEMVKSQNGHLSWKWTKIPFVLLVIWLMFFISPYALTKQYAMCAFMILTFTFSYAYFSHDLTWGSLWCWVANILAIIIIGQVFWKDICM